MESAIEQPYQSTLINDMKFKQLTALFFLGGSLFLSAQNTGNVGINTTTPTATLHVLGKGNTATTQSLKVENSDGTNLLTINDNGTVSGSAVANFGGGGGSNVPVFVNAFSDVTITGESQMVNINGNAIVTLPSTPSNGQVVYVISPASTGGINANGKMIVTGSGDSFPSFNYSEFPGYRITLLLYNGTDWYNPI